MFSNQFDLISIYFSCSLTYVSPKLGGKFQNKFFVSWKGRFVKCLLLYTLRQKWWCSGNIVTRNVTNVICSGIFLQQTGLTLTSTTAPPRVKSVESEGVCSLKHPFFGARSARMICSHIRKYIVIQYRQYHSISSMCQLRYVCLLPQTTWKKYRMLS